METHLLYLVACGSRSSTCKHVKLGFHRDSPRTTIRFRYIFKSFYLKTYLVKKNFHIIFIPTNYLLNMYKYITVRVGILYMLAGIGGSTLSALFITSNISVGASGALFGLLGAMLSELLTNWTIYANKVRTLIIYMIYNLLCRTKHNKLYCV